MSGRERGTTSPAERCCAWGITFLLTLLLTFTLLISITVHTITSAALHVRVATDDGVLERQIQSINDNIDLLADEYGFSAESVKAAVSRDELIRMNQNVAAWWTRLLTEGAADAFPRWYSESIENAVYETINEETLQEDPRTVVADLTEMIERTVFPMRETLLTSGIDLVKEQVDLSGTIRSVRKLPMLGLMLCLLTAGLIALLLGRNISGSLKYYGTAAAGTGFLILTAGIMLLTLRLERTIALASGNLAGEFGVLMGKVGLVTGLITIGLIGIGYVCLYLYRNKTKTGSIAAMEQTE